MATVTEPAPSRPLRLGQIAELLFESAAGALGLDDAMRAKLRVPLSRKFVHFHQEETGLEAELAAITQERRTQADKGQRGEQQQRRTAKRCTPTDTEEA